MNVLTVLIIWIMLGILFILKEYLIITYLNVKRHPKHVSVLKCVKPCQTLDSKDKRMKSLKKKNYGFSSSVKI